MKGQIHNCMAELTDREKEQMWQRGQDALARIMKYVSVKKIEALADKIEDADFRDSILFKQFLKTLK